MSQEGKQGCKQSLKEEDVVVVVGRSSGSEEEEEQVCGFFI